MGWAFSLKWFLGAGMLFPVLTYMISFLMFALYFMKDTPNTRARLPGAYMAVMVAMLFQALFIPLYLITATKSVSQNYINLAKKAQGFAVD